MSKQEYLPLLKEGFQEIGLWELDKYFLEPFGENEQRRYLINRLQEYLKEVSLLGLEVELWIDGSFSTKKPEPEDIDIAFLFNKIEIDELEENKQEIFSKLFMDREKIRARYSCDVYFIDKNNSVEKDEWIKMYGFDYNKINKKGIYKVILKGL